MTVTKDPPHLVEWCVRRPRTTERYRARGAVLFRAMADSDSSAEENVDKTSAERRALADELFPLFYEELRRIGRRERRRGGAGDTMQTTALVNEAYLKLRASKGWTDDRHFLSAAALAMRHALVNHAKGRVAKKRGGGDARLSLTQADLSIDTDEGFVALSDALERLAAEAPRAARVVECRYFAGYSEPETARVLGISERTVRREWTLAKAWLYRELSTRNE
jgi:RNA polymerase sigma factor (TIGR02999 family)